MTMSKGLGVFLIAGAIMVFGAELGKRFAIPGVHSLISSAEARVGRPLTPVSVAGVARRSTRRAVVYGGAATAAVEAVGHLSGCRGHRGMRGRTGRAAFRSRGSQSDPGCRSQGRAPTDTGQCCRGGTTHGATLRGRRVQLLVMRPSGLPPGAAGISGL